MTMSGCANSERSEGTSLPTKGTAVMERECGTRYSAILSRAICCWDSSPYDTRSILATTNGMIECSSSPGSAPPRESLLSC